jgi:hypothetical protein
MMAVVRSLGTSRLLSETGEAGASDDTSSLGSDLAVPVGEPHASPEEPSQALADLRPLKKVARGLPETDPVRVLIEGEPDRLPMAVLAAKADSWVLLLLRGD